MPTPDLSGSWSKRPATLNAVLQLVTLAVLGTGGVVGKSAYDDLAERLTEARIEAASMRAAIESLSNQRDAQAAQHEATRARVEALDLRLTSLEVQARETTKRR